MKPLKLLIAFCVICSSLFSCKKVGIQEISTNDPSISEISQLESHDTNFTFKNLLLESYNYDQSVFISQERTNGNFLYLHRYNIPNTEYNLYELTEVTPGNIYPLLHSYYITLDAITQANLEDFPKENGEMYIYANSNFYAGGNERIKVKYLDNTYDLEALPLTPEDGAETPICYNYYLLTYNLATGEILSEEFLFTVCDLPNSGGSGGGGGNGGNNNGDDGSDDNEDEDETLSSELVEWEVSTYPNHWTLNSIEKLSGIRRVTEREGGHFTEIKHENVYFFSGNLKWNWEKIAMAGSLVNPQLAKMHIKGWIKAKPNNVLYPYEEPAENFQSWKFKDVF